MREQQTDRQQRATERRLQAPCQNSVQDSGAGGRGGRESTIWHRELTIDRWGTRCWLYYRGERNCRQVSEEELAGVL